MAPRADTALAKLLDGLLVGREGRRIDIAIGGRPTRAILDRFRLYHRDQQHEVRLDLSAVETDGLALDTLTAVARGVRVDALLGIRFVASAVDLRGRAPLESVIGWLDAHVAGWSMSVDREGHVELVHARLPVRFTVEPTVRRNDLRVRVRAVRWRRMGLSMPSVLRPARTVSKLRLADGVTLDAVSHDRVVHFTASLGSIGGRLGPGRMLDLALREGPRTWNSVWRRALR
jgi:hypothetical protein